MKTLTEARMEFRKAMKGGDWVGCPCCGKRSKIYKRRFNSQMAIFLIKLIYRSGPSMEWVDMKDLLRSKAGGKNSSDGTYLRHWGLIEAKPGKNGSGRRSGIWRPTPAGVAFANGETLVASHVLLYNNVLRGYGTEKVDIRDALGSKFDYDELMRPAIVQVRRRAMRRKR